MSEQSTGPDAHKGQAPYPSGGAGGPASGRTSHTSWVERGRRRQPSDPVRPHGGEEGQTRGAPAWKPVLAKSVRRSLVLVALALLVEYLVVPELIGASRDLYLLGRIRVGWAVASLGLEALSLLCYGLLTRAVLTRKRHPGLWTLLRIDLAAAAVAHVVPAGTLGSAGIGYRLFTAEGISPVDTGVMMATKGIGSTLVLNVLLWVSLVVSVPLAGFRPIYLSVAILGAVLLLAVTVLALGVTRGTERVSRLLGTVGRRIPKVEDRLERAVVHASGALRATAADRRVIYESLLWASLNWLLDAASLWCFVAAFGRAVDPVELFAAYGIANVAGALPITPAGLGVVDSVAPLLLVSFGVTRNVATLGVLGWRLVNFWMPIPAGAAAYASLKAPGGLWRKARDPDGQDDGEGSGEGPTGPAAKRMFGTWSRPARGPFSGR